MRWVVVIKKFTKKPKNTFFKKSISKKMKIIKKEYQVKKMGKGGWYETAELEFGK